MLKNIIIILFAVLLIVSCSSGKNSGLKNQRSEDLINMGWKAFSAGKYGDAEKYFSELSTRTDEFLVGYYGLGWTYLKRQKYVNAKNELNKFFTLDVDGLYRPSGTGVSAVEDSIFRNVRAGQLIVLNALGEHQEAIEASNLFATTGSIITNWRFSHDKKISIVDLRIIRAVSHLALGDYQLALNMIKLIDPDFDADVSTIEGRQLVNAKIEELIALL